MERQIQIHAMILFIVCSFLVAPIAASNSMFLFGDTFLETGNNNYINVTAYTKANFYPYGVSFFSSPTGRFSNGRLIPDFLAKHANLQFIPPFLQPGDIDQFRDGVSFASGGSGALVQTFQGGAISLNMQLHNYKKLEEMLKSKLGDKETISRFSEAVYLFSTGLNDYVYIFLTKSTFLTTYSKSQVVDMVISNITSAVKEVYKSGGRKFGFLNVQDVGCLPGFRILTTDGGCMEEASSYAIKHNEHLLRSLELQGNELPGFKYSVFDFNTCVQRRIDNPSKYGYKETGAACCRSGRLRGEFSCGGRRGIEQYQVCDNKDEYVFWDAFHLTEKLYLQCSDEIWNSPNNSLSYGSYTIKDLFHLP